MNVPLQEWWTEGRWDLPIAGFEVSHMTLGALLVDIVAYGDGGRSESGGVMDAPSARIRFEGEFDLVEPDGDAIRLDPSEQEWEALTPLFALRHDRITKAVVTASDARLEIQLTSSRRLVAGPDPHYENWEITGPGFRLISRPGGAGVAYFEEGA